MALLETEVGLRLFDRGPGGPRLTHAGRVLLEHAEHIARRLELAETQLDDIRRDRRDLFRLGAFPTASTNFIPSAIARLRGSHPDLRVRLSEDRTNTLEARLLGGEFDCVLGYQDADAQRLDFDGAHRVDLLQETFLLGLPPGHRLARDDGPVSLADFAEDDWIMPSLEGFLIHACRDAGFEPRVVSTTSDPLTTRGLIARGLGVGWVPSLLRLDYTGVVIRPIRDAVSRRDVYALLPPGDRHPLAGDLLQALRITAAELTDAP